ncbi:hypothetical protein N7460_011594 [Penicillium canescens]|uniref:Uncharacterized protein n=1 Tax=Penicillium canescens TaxID=5083 RepID=A0AAD6I0X0_PENCN|nr:hypothetical protein N7460_011594 [Penicillium canescens]KAJ6040062.1 hypothetical protein N7444_008967 [Penicillium canescens]
MAMEKAKRDGFPRLRVLVLDPRKLRLYNSTPHTRNTPLNRTSHQAQAWECSTAASWS